MSLAKTLFNGKNRVNIIVCEQYGNLPLHNQQTWGMIGLEENIGIFSLLDVISL